MMKSQRRVLGWREWVYFPEMFGPRAIKAKMDTGAKTSALHAEQIEPFRRRGRDYVRFYSYPMQKSKKYGQLLEAPLVDRRNIRSSIGLVTERHIVLAALEMAGISLSVELSLISRDLMGFRLLLGRDALKGCFLVDPGRSFLLGRNGKREGL